jgi:hypothetical protein
LNFSSHHEKLCPTISAGSSSTSLGNTTSNGNVVSSKTRIRWTKDLHEKFVDCVNRLGGAESKYSFQNLSIEKKRSLISYNPFYFLLDYRGNTKSYIKDDGF